MSSGFITEKEIAEQRLKRQEEWEKVRQPDEPEEVPEEKYDHRSLFDRLEEQKQKRDLEFEETHKLKNMIRGLDDDEVNFLDLVEQRKIDAELKTNQDEARELREFRDARAKAEEASLDHRIKNEIKTCSLPTSAASNSSRTSQGRLLAGVLVRKRPAPPDTHSPPEKRPADLMTPKPADLTPRPADLITQSSTSENKEKTEIESVNTKTTTDGVAMRCIGILPGLGSYPDSSDSDASSDTDHEIIASQQTNQFDLVGRKISRPKHMNVSSNH